MARPFTPKVATSNHLLSGVVIYFTRPGWSRDLADAAIARTPDEAEALLAEASAFPLETVGAELVEVNLSSGHPAPAHFREAFRSRGPSDYIHAKQASHV